MKFGFEHISKRYGDHQIADHFSLLFEPGNITCLMGPSGCGKTTLLNLFSGLSVPDSGKIVGIEQHKISYVFQEPRLIPFLNVTENIAIVMQQKDELFVKELIELVDLGGNEQKYPDMLSGGMQQRVSFARALAYRPSIILADEPASNLDLALKKSLYEILKHYAEEHRTSVLMVTHEPRDCVDYSDDIYVLSGSPLHVIFHQSMDDSIDKKSVLEEVTVLLRNEELPQEDPK